MREVGSRGTHIQTHTHTHTAWVGEKRGGKKSAWGADGNGIGHAEEVREDGSGKEGKGKGKEGDGSRCRVRGEDKMKVCSIPELSKEETEADLPNGREREKEEGSVAACLHDLTPSLHSGAAAWLLPEKDTAGLPEGREGGRGREGTGQDACYARDS